MENMVFVTRMTAVCWSMAFLMGCQMNEAGNSDTRNSNINTQTGVVSLPAFELPPSQLISALTQSSSLNQIERWRDIGDSCYGSLSDSESRQCYNNKLKGLISNLHKRYDVRITSRMIEGIYTEEIAPVSGVLPKNKRRVLINLHGGGFTHGGRVAGQIESIPIAALGGIKVISVDYRKAPEYRFPAASEDVAAVYRELLQEYRPENIGIYGCSAGGYLTAQSIAWFSSVGLPMPGAIGMLCSGASEYLYSDAFRIVSRIEKFSLTERKDSRYLGDADPNSGLVFPTNNSDVLKEFPPSLIVSSTRDLTLSSAVYTHSSLIKNGVDADLHVWEGLRHCFFYDPEIPESHEVYGVVVNFFDQYLGAY